MADSGGEPGGSGSGTAGSGTAGSGTAGSEPGGAQAARQRGHHDRAPLERLISDVVATVPAVDRRMLSGVVAYPPQQLAARVAAEVVRRAGAGCRCQPKHVNKWAVHRRNELRAERGLGPAHYYFMLHKPAGFCSMRSPHSRAHRHSKHRSCYELLPPAWPAVPHVGRLDVDTEGLLLFTDDGVLLDALIYDPPEGAGPSPKGAAGGGDDDRANREVAHRRTAGCGTAAEARGAPSASSGVAAAIAVKNRTANAAGAGPVPPPPVTWLEPRASEAQGRHRRQLGLGPRGAQPTAAKARKVYMVQVAIKPWRSRLAKALKALASVAGAGAGVVDVEALVTTYQAQAAASAAAGALCEELLDSLRRPLQYDDGTTTRGADVVECTEAARCCSCGGLRLHGLSLSVGAESTAAPAAPKTGTHAARHDAYWVRVTISQGKYRQVRKLCGRADLDVLRLIRVALGPLELELVTLPAGASRSLTQREVARCYAQVLPNAPGVPAALGLPQPGGRAPAAGGPNGPRRLVGPPCA